MPQPRRLTPAEVDWFHELIHDCSGLDFPPSRLADLEQVIEDTIGSLNLPDVDALFALLKNAAHSEPVLQTMIADLTVGETYFFRNQPQFHALEHHILPELIERRRVSRHLRIWSAGCSTGEEPYSLAILLERLLPDLADWSIHLLATDINPQMLAKAEQGCYGEWSFRHVAAEIKETYFHSHGPELEIHPRLRARVRFARLNLAEDAFPSYHTQTGEIDLILCRNVLIYFRPDTVRRIVDRFYRATAANGWLIVGHAEPSQTTFARFTPRNYPGTVVYQKQLGADSISEPEASAKRSATPFANASGSEAPERKRPRSNTPDAEPSAYQKAKRLADQMQWEQAEQWIAVALTVEPLSAAAHYLRGLILLERGQPDEALSALRNCVFADANFVLAHMALADLLTRQGQTERARKARENVSRLVAGRPAHELIPEGDGLTAGRLLEIVQGRK